MDDDETIPLEQRNLSPRQFREVENLSPNSMQKLEKMGLGPKWVIFPGTKIRRCTPAAREEWHQLIAEIQAEYAAKLEAERKAQIEKMSVLGKLGTKSPKHPCNKNKKRVR
jgi:hypothetical protein